jgi:hypothetical protein
LPLFHIYACFDFDFARILNQVMAQKLCWGWGDVDLSEENAAAFSSSPLPSRVVQPLPHVAYLPVNSARTSYTHTNETAALATRLKGLLVVRLCGFMFV